MTAKTLDRPTRVVRTPKLPPAPAWINTETMTYLALMGVGAYLTVTSFGFGITTESSWVSAGTMPFGVGVLLLLISALLFLKSLRAVTVKRRSETQARVVSGERAQQYGSAREDADGENEVPPTKR